MSVNKPDISLIERYLNGELDARAMHELERQALDDPFLADALEGYAQKSTPATTHLNDLNQRLQKRIQPEKKRLGLFPKLSIAATVLIFIGLGSWYWLFNQPSTSVKDIPVADKTEVVKTPPAPVTKPTPQIIQPELEPAAPRWAATKPRLKTKKVKTHLLDDVKADSTSAVLANLTKLKADSGTNIVFGRAANLAAVGKVKQDAIIGYGGRLNDVVVVGYGTQLKQSATSSITTVQPQNIGQVLAGRVAGMTATDADKNKRGATDGFYIRGLSSINKSQPPLYIVDGKLVDNIDDINANDIASFNVLKDSSASAIYGSRAVNGVIIIKTKNSGLVKGKVVSADDQSPIPGAMVKVKGTNKAVTTDANGKFTIDADKNAELTFAYVGFDTKELKIRGTDSLKVALNADHKALSEVVVVGYGSTSDRTSASAQSLDEAALSKKQQKAQPVNGWKAFNDYLKQKSQSPDGKTGVVKVRFTVNTDNSVTDIKVVKSLSAEADAKAIDLIKNYQGWTANADGKPETVKVKIRFSKP